jgi:hypothetical protein
MFEIALNFDTRPIGTVVFDDAHARKMTRVLPSTVSLTQRSAPDRERIERFIDSVYAKSYGALIGQHYPGFISVHGRDGSIIAAAGFRCAGERGPQRLPAG